MPARKRTMPAPKRTTMPARKCRKTCAAPVPELPVCLLLEIAARTDAATIFRCAATCKPLRREILSAGFARRVCQGPGAVMPSRTLCLLGDNTFSVVHPHTAAFRTLERHYLSPFMSRIGAAEFLFMEGYKFQTSRNGLVVLSRREINRRRRSERRYDLCVYDPMTNHRAFLPYAPDIERDPYNRVDPCALLTAADGIGCSFMLVAVDMAKNLSCASSARVRVQTVSSSDSDAGGGAQWSPVKITDDHPCPRWCKSCKNSHVDDAVVVGGVVHWLMDYPAGLLSEDEVSEYILAYNVNAAAVGSVDIPKERQRAVPVTSSSQLASSPEGKLSFVATNQCTVSVWVLSSGGGSWERHVQIDMMAEWGQMTRLEPGMDHRLELVENFGDQRSGAVFLRFDVVFFFALNIETGATSLTSLTRETLFTLTTRETGIPYQVDLAYRLASMKSF